MLLSVSDPFGMKIRNPEDIKILDETLSKLKGEKRLALHYRYWEKYLIEDIADMLGRSWDYTDRLIETTISELQIDFFAIKKTKKCYAA